MSWSDRSLRVLGVALPDVSDRSDPLPPGKWSQFFKALGRRVALVDVARPAISKADLYLGLACAFHPDKTTWKARAGFNLNRVARFNASLERELLERSGSYDLIVQLQTLCSPRSRFIDTPYVIYTDCTMALIQRLYPESAAISPAAVRRWQAFETEVCQGAQRVFTLSEFARGSVIGDYECAPERVIAIGAGANQMLESVQGKDYSRQLAVFVGLDFERKGGVALLKAWRIVHQRLPAAELVIVGPKRNPVKGFGAGVRWAGRIDRASLGRLYGSATVFVLPSMFEPWGFVFGEAMGHGLPCIGSDCCAMPELIEDGVSGRLVARGAHEPLAGALIEILNDPDKAARMGRSGFERVVSSMTWPQVIDRLLSGLR